MIGDCFKGFLYTAFLGFAFLGIATVIPDTAWDKVPPRLVPLRAYLAEKGVISGKYRVNSNSAPSPFVPTETAGNPEGSPSSQDNPLAEPHSGFVCSGGVCRLDETEDRQDESPLNLPSRNDLQDSSEELVSHNDFTPAESPSEPEQFSLPNASQEPPKEGSDPVFIPEPSYTSSSDTLPDLNFGEEPFPEDEFPIMTNKSSPVVRGAEEDTQKKFLREDLANKGNSHLRTVGHTELNGFAEVDPITEDFQTNEISSNRNSANSQPLSLSQNQTGKFSDSGIPEPSVHEQIQQWVERSQGAGAIAASFLRLSEILDKYDNELTSEDRETLNNALDRLAYRVFYQPDEFILWNEYVVKKGETLSEIAQHYKVTPEFLAAINSLRQKPNDPLPEGTEMKVVQGPVSAEISFSKMELLLKFNGLYAGRFKMGCAERATQVRGEFPVSRKIKNPDYNGPIEGDQVGRIPGGDPRNPLGSYWIELAGGLGLQGTNHEEYVGQRRPTVGGLIFSNKDITHLNILLAEGSMVQVKD